MFLYLNSVTLICLLEKAPFNYIKEQWWKVTYIHSSNVLKYSFVPFYAALYLYSTFHIFKLASISQTNMRKVPKINRNFCCSTYFRSTSASYNSKIVH